MSKAALLVLDVQNELVDPQGKVGSQGFSKVVGQRQLLSWLMRQGADTVVLTGVYTHMVVDSAARYADDAGLYVKVVEDCCASPDPELHRVEIEKILPLFAEITSSEELLRTL